MFAAITTHTLPLAVCWSRRTPANCSSLKSSSKPNNQFPHLMIRLMPGEQYVAHLVAPQHDTTCKAIAREDARGTPFHDSHTLTHTDTPAYRDTSNKIKYSSLEISFQFRMRMSFNLLDAQQFRNKREKMRKEKTIEWWQYEHVTCGKFKWFALLLCRTKNFGEKRNENEIVLFLVLDCRPHSINKYAILLENLFFLQLCRVPFAVQLQ